MLDNEYNKQADASSNSAAGNDSTIKVSEMGSIMDTINNEDDGFTVEKAPTIIKVIGVGGGGDNAVNHMYQQNIQGVSFVVLNTDLQALKASKVPTHLLIGPNTTFGLGAGNIPDKAREAAEESSEQIAELFDDNTKMVFITAGMGGGTGTGAAPVVARIAREKGVLTVGIVTIPFLFEGRSKILKALEGADEMGKYVDALLVINNERLTEIYPDLDMMNAFGKADDTLTVAARSISEIITKHGIINLDFNDVNTTLRNGHVAIISTGYGEGENRVTKAIEDALKSPLLKNRDVYGSQKILLNIYFNPNAKQPFKISEMKEMNNFMAKFAKEVDVIWGTAYDETLDDRIKITVLAAGFNMSMDDEAADIDSDDSPKAAETSKATKSPKSIDNRIAEAYGAAKINDDDMNRARARYKVLAPDEIDNYDVIAQLENTPTLNRDPQFKITGTKRPAEAASQQAAPASGKAEQQASKHSTGPVIDFGA